MSAKSAVRTSKALPVVSLPLHVEEVLDDGYGITGHGKKTRIGGLGSRSLCDPWLQMRLLFSTLASFLSVRVSGGNAHTISQLSNDGCEEDQQSLTGMDAFDSSFFSRILQVYPPTDFSWHKTNDR